MKKKKKIKIRKGGIIFIVVIMIIILLEIFNPVVIIRSNKLSKLNYNKSSINCILNKGMYKEIIEIGENKTINSIICSKNYDSENYPNYILIDYYDQTDFTTNINGLLKLGYNTTDINIINHVATNDDISWLLKHDYTEDISEYLIFDFAKVKKLDRYIAYRNEEGYSFEKTVVRVNIGLDNDFYEVYEEVDKFSIEMLVNKYNKVGEKFIPTDLVLIEENYSVNKNTKGNKEMVNAFVKMADDMKNENLYILVNSGYRDYDYQVDVYNSYLKEYGNSYVKKYVANPGFSEHQTGLAVDIKAKNSDVFKSTKESTWLLENAYKYGFILRYPLGDEPITGYSSEPWHYRYIGVELAEKVLKSGLTYDEYYIRYLSK